MNIFSHPIQGKIEYIGYTEETMKEFFYSKFPELKDDEKKKRFWIHSTDPLSRYYCFTEYIVWRLNKELARGKVIVGSIEGYEWRDDYILTDKKNIIKAKGDEKK